MRPHLALLVIAACGGHLSTSVVEADPVWLELELPLDGGQVLWSDPEILTVAHGDGDPGPLIEAYAVALEASGHRRTVDISVGALGGQRWAAPDGSAIDLAVTPRPGGGLLANVTRVPGVIP